MPAEACAIAILPSGCWSRRAFAADSPLVRQLDAERRAADRELQRELQRWKARGFSRQWRDAVGALKWREIGKHEMGRAGRRGGRMPGASCRAWSAPTSPACASFWRKTAHPGNCTACGWPPSALRYTLELFRPCYPAGLEERLDALKKLQDSLGEVNDAVASARLLREALKRQPKVRKFLDDRAAEQAAEFIRHWKETFDAPGREAWWTDFLSKPGDPTKNIPARRSENELREARVIVPVDGKDLSRTAQRHR